MADEISIGSKAIKEIQDLRAELVKLSQDALQAGKNMQTISTPGGLTKSTESNAKTISELESLKVKYASLSDTIVKNAEKSRLAEIRLQQQREKAFDSFEKNAKKEEAIAEKNNQLYNKTQAQVNTLTKAYNELATRKERYNNLSANEEMRLATLQRVTEKYNGVLKGVDATIGKNQRNVGNYASGYNALGNSINQLTREAPAFANSLQTGFMAISNNFAALQDAVKGIIAQNKILKEEGKPTESVFKQLAGGIFSWTTAISIGVTLLTVYGAKLVDLALGLGDVEAELKTIKTAQDRYNKSLEDANDTLDHNAILEKNKAKAAGASSEQIFEIDKKTAADKLANAEKLRDINKGIYEDELKKRGFIKDSQNVEVNDLNRLQAEKLKLTSNKAAAKNAQEAIIIARKKNKRLKEIEIITDDEILKAKRDNFNKSETEARLLGKKLSEISSENNAGRKKKEEDWLKYLYEANRKEIELRLLTQETILAKEFTSYQDQYKALQEANALKLMLIKLDYNEQVRLAKGNANKIKSANLDMQMSIIKDTEDYAVKLKGIRNKENEEYITEIKSIEKFLEDYHAKEDAQTQASLDVQLKADKAEKDILDKKRARLIELQKATKDYLDSFTEEFASKSGFGETFNAFFKQIDNGKGGFTTVFKNLLEGAKGSKEEFGVYFNAIAETAQETYNFISGLSTKNFDEEKERLQSQYEVAFAFANGNKEAEQKLALDLEAQKKEIANRENKAKQKQAIFNIAIDTAQGIVAALTSTPPNVLLSVAIGAIGAAQIAAVSAQEVPQYWMGGTHDGGLMMVNDGSGSNYKETIVYPDGKIVQPKGRNVIMDAPAGTEIFTQDQWDMQLQNMLQGKGISMNASNTYSGISKEQLEDVMVRTIGSKPNHYTNFDANGASEYVEKRGNITRRNIARGNGKGQRF